MRPIVQTVDQTLRAAGRAVREAGPRRRDKPQHRGIRVVGYPLLAGVGALLAYLFDPAAGRGRRHRLVDRSTAVVRRSTRRARAKASYAGGRTRGVVARASGKGRPHPVDDVEVKHQVQQALARSGLHRRDVLVDVCDRTATLRGELATEGAIAKAEAATRDVPGVEELVNDLHLPGEPPRNKVVALRVS